MGADRTPNGAFGQNGLLQRITYPTGGFEEFTYEPQTIGFNELANTTNTIVLTGNGDGTNLLHTYNVNTLLVKKTHTAKLAISASENLATPNSPAPDGSTLVRVKVLDGATILIDRSLNSYTGEVYDVPLSANKVYTIQLNVWGQTHTGRADFIYDTAATDIYVWSNKDVGGLRVKKIGSYDPVSNKWLKKYYTYATRTDLTKSSGSGAYKTDFVKPYLTGYSCQVGQASIVILNCDNYMVSSSSLFPYYSYSGSHVAYKNVIESDDANFANGGTEHYFQTEGGVGLIQQILGPTSEPGGSPNPTALQGVPQNTVTDMNGTEWKTVVFKNSTGQFIPLKEVVNTITFDSRISNQTFGYVVRKRWAAPYHYIPPVEDEFRGYDLVKYAFVSYWPHLDATTVTDYDQNGQNPQVTTTTYTYGSVNHLAVTKVETVNSKLETMGASTKYPEDFAYGNDVYTAMLQKGITTTPIEQSQSRGTKLISDSKTDFKDWLNDQTVLMPEVIKTQKGLANAEARIRYYGYDATANTLEVSKESGSHISYIWDYWNNFPIAEVQNASYSNIAYTSFEATGKGRWVFAGTPVVDATAISGKKDYVLSSGSVTRDLLTPSTTYMVTYWSKSGQVTSVGGTVRTLMTIAPWVLYEHMISGVSSVTLSGTATIDELRLYPKGAFMATNCYEPYVGTSCTCSANNAFTYYEYDGFKRLLLIRDSRKNILKQYDYKYGQLIVPCTNSAASWQPTGNYRCVKDQTNNNTGEQLREEMDMNNCSLTYLSTHWVTNGISTQCPVAPPCIGQDKRIVNGVCETGTKITTGSIKISKTQWQCTFHYVWSDGFVGPDLTEISNSPCLVAQ